MNYHPHYLHHYPPQQIFTLHPIDQPSNQQPWPSPVHHPVMNVHHTNVQATSQVTAPPLAYYYSSPRSSEDSGREDGPYRGRPSYLRRRKSSISFISNNRQSDHEERQTTDLFFLLIFLLFFGFLKNNTSNGLAMNANISCPTSSNPMELPYHRYLVSQVPTHSDPDRLGLSAFGYLQLIDWMYILDGFKIVYKDAQSDKEIEKMRQCANFIFEQVEKEGIREFLKYGPLEKLVSDWEKTEKNKKLELNFFDPLQRELEALMTNFLRKVFLNKRILGTKCPQPIPNSTSSFSLDSAYFSDNSQITAPSQVSASHRNRGYRELSTSHSENIHSFESPPKTILLQRENLKIPTLSSRKPKGCNLPSQLDLDDPNVRSLIDKLKNLETS